MLKDKCSLRLMTTEGNDLFLLNTNKCPVGLVYERGWDVARTKRNPKSDYLLITHNQSSILMKPQEQKIIITGDISEMAMGLALFMQDTFDVIENDIIDEAFQLEKDRIAGCNWPCSAQIDNFIKEYNRVFPTVMLLK